VGRKTDFASVDLKTSNSRLECFACADDFGEDVRCAGGPYEWLWRTVVLDQVRVNRIDEVVDAGKRSTSDGVHSNVSEKTFDGCHVHIC